MNDDLYNLIMWQWKNRHPTRPYIFCHMNPKNRYYGKPFEERRRTLKTLCKKAGVKPFGYIVSSVVDIFESDGKAIAILDTSVNHMPEVFEYQYQPDVMQESKDGKYTYTLAGCTCLAGDLFGDYKFRAPLKIGSRIVFEGMGAYTLVKANMFNGVNLPSVYALTSEGKLELKKRFGYEDFLSRCGVNNNDSI